MSEPQVLDESEKSQTLLERINDLTTKLATFSAQQQKELEELRAERDLWRQLLDEQANSQQLKTDLEKATEKEIEFSAN